ncbi:MAG: hypothetical protein IAE78_21855 [Myxococcus sp.]|nr:hypothetical protein [Myxococcus sp.]
MILPNSIRVGGEVDAHCNKCDMNLAHTILAMVGTAIKRVQCNTCNSQHMFRGQQPLAATSLAAPRKAASTPRAAASRAPRAPRSEVVVISFDEQLKGKDLTRARKYSIKETFKVDDVIDHPTFGFGIVSAVRVDKIDITFKSDVKTLAHGKGGGEQKPAFTHPQAPAGALADKPPAEEAPATTPEPAPEG